jgi:uncharacterized membrane protein YraQ (UPF0718 family)
VPTNNPKVQGAILEAFHILSQQAVIKYLGSQTKKWISYTVASVSGKVWLKV